MAGEIRIGTSGWSYPAGRGSWNGIFYPRAGTRRGRRFDELAYYADHFNTVEVNSTFYRLPSVATARSWAERTPHGFEFSVKLYQAFTHPGMMVGTSGAQEPPAGLEKAPPVPVVTAQDVDEFRDSIEPLAQAGKLGAVLAQFPPSYKQTPQTVDYLEWLLRSLADYAVAVELRDRTWSDSLATTLALLNQHRAAWVQIDEPKFRLSVRQNRLPNVSEVYYMRLHGRNAERWWKHEKSEDRYDYLYSPDELKPFAETAAAVRTIVRKAYLYLNNHFAAKAVADALELKHQLGEPITGEYGAELLDSYPFLRQIPGCVAQNALLPPPA